VLLLRGQGRCEHCAQARYNVSHGLHSSRVAWEISARHEHLTKLKLYSPQEAAKKKILTVTYTFSEGVI